MAALLEQVTADGSELWVGHAGVRALDAGGEGKVPGPPLAVGSDALCRRVAEVHARPVSAVLPENVEEASHCSYQQHVSVVRRGSRLVRCFAARAERKDRSNKNRPRHSAHNGGTWHD